MCKSAASSAQDRRFILDIKEALAVAHRGPDAMPRKAVWMGLGKSESWYSLCLNPEEPDYLLSLLDLRRYAAITGNAEPLRVLARWWGDGHEIAETEQRLLSSTLKADGAFEGRLSEALEDGAISLAEAQSLLPVAEARLRQAQESLDLLRHKAGRTR
jgi:hypothetical protein